ncbi:MAG TPA: dihydroorotate dehydrogenase [Planctomycetota bacterium]|jgi:dihydroorotate dehydrogenase (NAD+) catalytic subunit|nr:dihydroorotate dehydrogenase [Planctomycetota bacterium]
MLEVSIGALRLRNPVLTASGTFGHSTELAPFATYADLGAIVLKTVTPLPRPGNPPPRLFETPAGMLNSIGLENRGVECFLAEELPAAAALPVPVVVNIGAETPGDFAALAARVGDAPGCAAIEANLSCPNIQGGALPFSSTPQGCAEAVRRIRAATRKPLLVKLSPNVTRIADVARAAEGEGADALTAVNTLLGFAVDWRARRPRLGAGWGGLSGPAIRPVALRMVYECARAVSIPVVGCGGIASAEDVCEFLAAGATAVQVGTWNYVDPTAACRIARELPGLLRSAGIRDVRELVGSVRVEEGGAAGG